ncbi:MAG: carbamoyltransferase HypF [Chloroflexota bacterium]
MAEVRGAHIHVRGVVQGVGFRPFVYGLATRLALTGWVRNTSSGVDIEVDGAPQALAAFVRALRDQAPPLARIDTVEVRERPADGYAAFEIVGSEAIPLAFQPISPDVAICDDCLRELFDPADRRYRYPFINCTNCGPRFTIICDIPYDRPNTTMAGFAMCPDCAAEYSNPLDRRFHAQPVACPACGPQVWLVEHGGRVAEKGAAITAAREKLKAGQIVAVKGLGGFHLACDASNPEAVAELRRRKLRVEKPFAVMLFDLGAILRQCDVSPEEQGLLQSRERPIVIVNRSERTTISRAVAPGQDTLGLILPYTPLHYLLLEPEPGLPDALVMTSGNRSEEPIATDNDEALARLAPLADSFLSHDRPIHMRCDDSVVRPASAVGPGARPKSISQAFRPTPLRRARGYAPLSIRLPWQAESILAVGAELKNTFCLMRDEHAFMSHHIGDLENYETLRSFEDGIGHFERLFRIQPKAIAYDLHPDYLATRYALKRSQRDGLPAIPVQHHHAHVASCLVENGLTGERPVLGVGFDGSGFGDDGAVWGGEFLLCDYVDYRRLFHLEPVALPGGDRAIREPWRMALSWLMRAGIAWEEDLPPLRWAPPESRSVVRHLIEASAPGLVPPRTTSLGRLFDAVSSLAGVRHEVTYEGQAAIELEALVDPEERRGYEIAVLEKTLDPTPAIRQIVADLRAGVSRPRIAARFHRGLALAVRDACRRAREGHGVAEVALSGGVWQNMALLSLTRPLLEEDGFIVYTQTRVPPNDGGLALGQAAVAAQRLRQGRVASDAGR